MSENCSDVDCGSDEVSDLLVNEKGRNKRKFLADLSLDLPAEVSRTSLTEFPRYEMLEEKFRNALNELGSIMERSEDSIEEEDIEEFQESDWEDPVTCQLEELLTNNLFATFCSAVKKIVESGYTEEIAEWAVLNSSLFHGSKDAVSNVVDGAMTLLKREKELGKPKHPVFDGLQSLVDYTLLEMIYVLREVRPTASVLEAMWSLLISDLNLVNACVTEGGPEGGSCSQGASGENQTLSQSKSETSGTSQSKDSNNSGSQPKAPAASPVSQPTNKQSPGELDSPGKESSPASQEAKGNSSAIDGENIQTSSQGTAVDDKSGVSRKGLSINSKRDMLRQKAFQFEKNYKGRLSKGAFKAKVAAWGSMVLDKSLRSSSSVAMKGALSKLPISAASVSSVVEGNNHPASNSPSLGPTSSVKDAVFALPAVSTKSHASAVPDAKCGSKSGANASDTPKAVDYYASIPFDETLQKHVPQDDKDEAILILTPYMQDIQKELQGWTEWANEKVMQAARRLGKEQAELKMLRQEKEEIEKFKKEKQALEESTQKRLSEMEYALSNATNQIEVAKGTTRRLEDENNILKNEMEAAKVQTLRAASNLQTALQREQETVKKLQSWEAEKCLVQEKLTNLKRDITALNSRIEKAKGRQDQFKALWKQEEKEKLKNQKQIDSLRRKLEEEEAVMKAEADNIKKAAEKDMLRCEDGIKNLQNMIAEMRLESNRSKIAALNMGYGSYLTGLPGSQLPKVTKRLAVFQDFGEEPDVKQERECIMCMTDEISVVFIPCAHQVLCGPCNVLHEKQGMNDCPSCRTIIQKRVSVTYRAD
ncbi:hypothetical protein C2S53_020345 [Perilla frutescens var. hirtella]|uniref:RING-type domain-containing protein n=1 Tax=Perilla frutescens var. hirtella TaxID=608512 RepID=A0AAD4P6E0_PERFH|nr:hypothetical protein C2S53_020345 [Perilla frutescens var. hirtella]